MFFSFPLKREIEEHTKKICNFQVKRDILFRRYHNAAIGVLIKYSVIPNHASFCEVIGVINVISNWNIRVNRKMTAWVS